MTNINSKIEWQTGMEVTPQTFIEFDKNIDNRQQVISMASNGNLFGIIPYTPFNNKAVFVRKNLEIERLMCMALLSNGKILHIDEPVTIQIPLLYGDTYYFSGCFGKNSIEFKQEGIPFTRPEHQYGIYTLAELEANHSFPMIKFKVDEGIFSIDKDYIPPFLTLASSERFAEFINKYSERITQIATHPNLESGEAKRTFIRYAFKLKHYNQDNKVRHFIQLMQEIVQAIDFYIITPNTTNPITLEKPSEYDIVPWLNWISDYINGAISILDKVVLEDHSIDLEKLKKEIKEELYKQLYASIYPSISEELKISLTNELSTSISDMVLKYINEELREKLYKQLFDELSTSLQNNLFDDLYNALYIALYVPVSDEEKDEFMPLI